jgi:hypothetical protein
MFVSKFHRLAAGLLSLAGAAGAALPSPWLQTDIGSTGLAGSGSVTSGVFTVAGSGADVWGSADAFHFVYQRLNGNTQMVAKVTGVQNTNAWAKAGVMIREDLTPGSRNAFLLVSAASGASFQSRATPAGSSSSTVVTGVAAPFWIKLCRSGDLFTAFRSPDGVTWTLTGTTRVVGMQPVVYAGLAVTSHNNSAKCTATFSNVQFLAPPALFVVGSASLNAGDAAAKKRLEALGYAVTVKTATASATADANGKDLVVISSTVGSADVGTKFTNAAVPVVTWEQNLLSKLGMTGAVSGTDFGTTTGQTDASIYTSACDFSTMYTSAKGFADGCQDLAGGLYGTFGILRSAGTVAWGKPGAAAIKIAYQSGNTGKTLDFAYDKGAAMPGLAAAPARRVFLFMTDNSSTTWTLKGQTLFDQAVYWATNTRYYLVKKVLQLNFDPVMHTQGNVLMHTWGSTKYSWLWYGDPILLLRQELADLTEGSGGYVRWKLVKYAGIPDYIDRWAPIIGQDGTTPVTQFNSTDFTEQNFIDNYDQGPTLGRWKEAGEAMPNGGHYMFDYNKVFDDYGVDAKINAGEIDEVVLSTGPMSGVAESGMAGRSPYYVNGPIVIRNTSDFVFMGQSYERRLSEALENFGHRTEWQVSRAFYGFQNTKTYNRCYYSDWNRGDENPADCFGARQTPVLENIYDKFVMVEGILPGEAGVGAAHWAPNVLSRADEYVWNKDNFVYSMADDWAFNYPNLIGAATKRLVNVDEWTPMDPSMEYDRGRAFKKWMYHHMPRLPGHYVDAGNAMNNHKLNNWWEYIVNFDRHPESR